GGAGRCRFARALHWSHSSVSTTQRHNRSSCHSKARAVSPLVRWLSAADPVRESPPGTIGGAEGANPPRNLSGPRTARVRSLWQAGRVSTASALTDGEGRGVFGRSGEALRSR